MANSTFSGPIRSESTIKTISKNATTGTITEVTTFGGAPVSLDDLDQTLDNATHSGRVLLVPDGGQDNTYTLPAPIVGSVFRFVYSWRRLLTQQMLLLLHQEIQTFSLVELHI